MMLSCHIKGSKMNDLETLKHIRTSPVYSLPYRSCCMVQAQREANRLSIIIIATFSHVLCGWHVSVYECSNTWAHGVGLCMWRTEFDVGSLSGSFSILFIEA